MTASTSDKKKYFLYLSDKSLEERITARIEKLGATVVEFLEAGLEAVVSDHACVDILIAEKKNENCVTSQSVASSSMVSSSNEGGAGTIDKPGVQAKIAGNEIVGTQGEAAGRRVRKKKGKKPTIPIILKETQRMGLKIMRHDDFEKFLRTQRKDQGKVLKKMSAPPKRSGGRRVAKPKIFRLIKPFIKVEDRARQYRPIFEALDQWPKINLEPGRRGCVFSADKDGATTASQNPRKSSSSSTLGLRSPKRKRKAARKLNFNETRAAAQAPESVNRSLAIESTYDDESEKVGPAYCELCEFHAENLAEHLASEDHRKVVNSGIYQQVDQEIAQAQSLDQFLAECLLQLSAGNKCSGTSSPGSSRRGRASTSATPSSFLSPPRKSMRTSSPSTRTIFRSPSRSPLSPRQPRFRAGDTESPIATFSPCEDSEWLEMRKKRLSVKRGLPF